ncbi:MAG: AbrB/MazE/SpoVT family DNA-binding domain-containing protein [bacterium]|nr:AbrB/MazE/SpoVT family DNA-binding domain-containing protein [bacterium]
MQDVKAVVSENGAISLPAKYRKALDLKPGDEVTVKLDKGGLRIISSKQVVKRAQELVRCYIPVHAKLVDSLIRDRRLEAQHE